MLETLWKRYRFLKEVGLLKSKVKQLEPSDAVEQLLLEIDLLIMRGVTDDQINDHLQANMECNTKGEPKKVTLGKTSDYSIR